MKKMQWITCNKEWQSPVFRKSFTLENQPESAKIKICGLGFFELYINGKRVSEDYFQPVWSDYEKRDLSSVGDRSKDEFTHRVYYLVYDVKDYLRKGKNVIAVMLGNGWYRQNVRNVEGNLWYGEELKLAFKLTLKNGGMNNVIITSDLQTKCRNGHIISNNIYYGETHDYALYEDYFSVGYDDGDWENARKTNAPKAEFTKQDCPPDRVIRSVKPVLLYDYGKIKIYDAGENISGWAAVKALNPACGAISVRYAEEIKEGKLNFASAGGEYVFDGKNQIQSDIYFNVPAGTFMHPHFTWHAFRYIEVTGENYELTVQVVHSDVPVIKEFKSGNEVHNWLFEAFIRTQLGNMHAGVPSDCPHRERLGYTGDGQLACDTAMTVLGCKKFYKKWIQDILDCQDIKSGHVQHTAPFYGGGGGPGGWGGAIVIVPYTYYKHYKDKKLLEKCLPHMLKWLGSMRGFCDKGLVVREYEGGWCLGEWCTPDKVTLPEPFVNTYYYIKCMRYVEEIGKILGKEIDLSQEISQSLNAIESNYYDKKTQTFCSSVQGADAFGLDLGLGGEQTFDNLVNKYSVATGFDTGIFGTDVLCKVLCENGRRGLVLRLLSLTEYPSFGYMKARGAATLWENWNGAESHNHPMFGACLKYLF